VSDLRFLPFWTLFKKEVLRFMAVVTQTLLAPVVSASLYLFVFGLSLGGKISILPNFSYLQFVVPGLILMGVVNNSFANSSSSLFMSRYIGNIAELLVTPITPTQFIAAYTLAAMLRGILVGAVIYLVSLLFTPLPWVHPWAAFAVLTLASFLFAQFGIIAAIYSKSFDTLAMFTNFLILPLVYLGGLFYPVADLPDPWRTLSLFNPLYYLIEGFRKAVLGVGTLNWTQIFGVSGTIALGCFVLSAWIMVSGYRLRN
jgi:ABC-2 type transport system permease protein